jgi:hypothetical protein
MIHLNSEKKAIVYTCKERGGGGGGGGDGRVGRCLSACNED